MEDTVTTQAAAAAVREAVTDAQSQAREQVSAAWQLLDSGWRQRLEEILGQRFAEIGQRLEQHISATSEAARQQAEQGLAGERESATRQITERLNQTARRMKQAENREVWIQAFLERASDFCGRAALFAVKGKTIRYEGGLGIDNGQTIGEFPLESGPAFANAVDARDTVVTMSAARELSAAVAGVFGENPDSRVYLLPFSYRGKVVGVLYAETAGPNVDVNGLELLTALAETTIDTGEPERVPEGLIRILPPEARSASTPAPVEWSVLPRPDQEVHGRAERFARNRVAQILLYKIHQVRVGRDSRDLYATLKEDIDAGRESFREQFLQANPGVPDYFHAELVRTLAKGDATMLGPGYPGELG